MEPWVWKDCLLHPGSRGPEWMQQGGGGRIKGEHRAAGCQGECVCVLTPACSLDQRGGHSTGGCRGHLNKPGGRRWHLTLEEKGREAWQSA